MNAVFKCGVCGRAVDDKVSGPNDLDRVCRHCFGEYGSPTRMVRVEPSEAPEVANERLCSAIVMTLACAELTPEARTLITMALRAQRGEPVSYSIVMEKPKTEPKS